MSNLVPGIVLDAISLDGAAAAYERDIDFSASATRKRDAAAAGFSSSDVVGGIVQGVMNHRLREAEEALAAGLHASGVPAVAGVPLLTTGISMYNANPERIVAPTAKAKPYLRNWQLNWTEGFGLFAYARAHLHAGTKEGVFTTYADLPIINYVCELAANAEMRARGGSGALRGAAAARAKRDTRWQLKGMGAWTAQEFRDRWNWAGFMNNPTSGGGDITVEPRADAVRAIGLTTNSVCAARNAFGDSIGRFDQLFWSVKHRDLSANTALIDPASNAVPGRAGAHYEGPVNALQVRGFTAKERPAHDTSVDDPTLFWAPRGAPHDDDVDYVNVYARVATTWHYVDVAETTLLPVSEASAEVEVRRVAAQEGAREAYESLPDFAAELYEYGHVIPVGWARGDDTGYVGEEARLAACRSQSAMQALPTIKLYAGL